MNYNYEEWERMKLKGLIKFTFDISNFMLMFILVSVFTIATLITRKILPFAKEFLIHFVFMIIILIVLWILAQLVKWNLYKKVTENIWRSKSNLVKFCEIVIGILSVWIPIGIFTSIYGMNYTDANWTIYNLNLNYVIEFIRYISIKCLFWTIGGILFELFVINTDDNYNTMSSKNFIIINKYI